LDFFKNWKISLQILSIGLTSLVGIVVIAVIYFFNTSKLDTFQNAQLHATVGSKLTRDIRYQFLEARRIEKDFLLNLNKAQVSRHQQQALATKESLEQLKQYLSDDASLALIEEVSSGFDAYNAQFKKVAAAWEKVGYTSKDGLRGRFSKAAVEIQEKTAQFYDDELIVTLMVIRGYEKDFLLSRDTKSLSEMKGKIGGFMASITELGIPDEDLKLITTLMKTYQNGIQSVSSIFAALGADTKKIDQLFDAAGPQFQTLLETSTGAFETAVSEAQSNSSTTKTIMATAIVVIAISVFVIGAIIGRGIARPVAHMTAAMTDLAEGNTTVDIPATEYKNELGSMADAVQKFKDSLIHMGKLEEEQGKQNEARQKRSDTIDERTRTFDQMVTSALDAIKVAASQMQKTSQSMSLSAEDASAKSSTVAAAAEEASANVQTVASAAEELSSSIIEIGRQVAQSRDISINAVKEVKHANDMVGGLTTAAQEIGDVVNLITDIAEQTNLLALNATIEAARAGDAGKGFAVVASEVKNLATQTAKATDEISSQISKIQDVSGKSVSAIKDIGNVVNEVSQIATSIASAVEQQNAATQEIARNVDEAAVGTSDVTQNITGVAQATQETGAATGDVLDAATELERQADSLESEVSAFLNDIKTA